MLDEDFIARVLGTCRERPALKARLLATLGRADNVPADAPLAAGACQFSADQVGNAYGDADVSVGEL